MPVLESSAAQPCRHSQPLNSSTEFQDLPPRGACRGAGSRGSRAKRRRPHGRRAPSAARKRAPHGAESRAGPAGVPVGADLGGVPSVLWACFFTRQRELGLVSVGPRSPASHPRDRLQDHGGRRRSPTAGSSFLQAHLAMAAPLTPGGPRRLQTHGADRRPTPGSPEAQGLGFAWPNPAAEGCLISLPGENRCCSSLKAGTVWLRQGSEDKEDAVLHPHATLPGRGSGVPPGPHLY